MNVYSPIHSNTDYSSLDGGDVVEDQTAVRDWKCTHFTGVEIEQILEVEYIPRAASKKILRVLRYYKFIPYRLPREEQL
jgi:hypothetical protein